MKKIYFSLLSAALFLSACGGGNSDNNSTIPNSVDEIKAKLSAKKDEAQILASYIKDLEKALATLDTTQKVEKKVLVTQIALAPKDFKHYIEVPAYVKTAENPARAAAETAGRLKSVLIKEGQSVSKGQLIATLSLESLEKSLEELTTNMTLAEDLFKRQSDLWAQKIGSEVQYLQAKTQLESLQKSKERLQAELAKANVYAPSSGFVEKLMLNVGEFCGPGSPIAEIVNSNNLKVIANVSESYIKAVKTGDQIRVTFPAIDKEQNVRVSNVGRIINSTNRTFEIEAPISTENGLVKPNLMATIFIQDYAKAQAMVIPSELIMQDVESNNYVMVNENGRAAKRIVTVGIDYKNESEIIDGLKAGDLLLIKGARQVVDGDLLEVADK